MNEVGKALIFYLTYSPEMEQIYEEGDHVLLGERQSDKTVIEKIDTVAAEAGVDAARLIESVVAEIRTKVSAAKAARWKPSRESTVTANWALDVELSPYRSRRKKSSVTRRFGIYLDRDGITPWLWSRGGRAVEERIIDALGESATCRRSTEMNWDGGSVALESIPIPWQRAEQFTLNADPIIARAQHVLNVISPGFMERFVAVDF